MKKASLAGAISLVVATASGAASAASIIEEVIVTAQKREQAITDVALTVTAVNGDVARAMGIQDTRDVAMLATNVDIKGRHGGREPRRDRARYRHEQLQRQQ